MKRWWIIFDDTSHSKTYNEIISFIIETFSSSNVLFNLIGISLIKRRNFEYVRNCSKLPNVVLCWCNNCLEIKFLFSSLGVAVINSYDATCICSSKFLQLKKLSTVKNLIPNTIFTNGKSVLYLSKYKKMVYPIVVKLASSVHGSGVFVINSYNELVTLITHNGYIDSDIMLQDYLSFSSNYVLKVFVIKSKIISCYIEINCNGTSSFKQHTLTEREQNLALQAIETLHLDCGSVDIIYQSSSIPLICEVNLLPNVLNIYRVSHVNCIQAIIDFLP